MIKNYTTTLREWENIIRVQLKVANPSLIKSGALGILSNYLASVKYDALQYYSKSFQEMNVGLAQDYNSLLYHASIYGAPLYFARPSVLAATLIIPEINVQQVETIKYFIPKYAKFIDTNGVNFSSVSQIDIELRQNYITAISWNQDKGTTKLPITRAPNPNVPGQYVYLVHTGDFEQFTRDFAIEQLPNQMIVGEPYVFTVEVNSISEISQVRVWLNTGEPIAITELDRTDTDFLPNLKPGVRELTPKFYKFDSSNYDDHIFMEFLPSSIQFTTGDGQHGALPEEGAQIIVEIRTTLGEYGNVPSSEFLVQNVEVTERWEGNTLAKRYNTNLNGISTNGSINGKSLERIDEIRNSVFERITIRDGIITENDYQILFEYDGIKPFVDAKFIDARAFVFLFNVIRSNDTVVASTSMNFSENDLMQNPFYPEIDYHGYTLVSPFYYKNNSENIIDAYMVNPMVGISLRESLTTPNPDLAKDYKIDLALTYDFTQNASFLEITSGARESLEYYIVTDTFRVTISNEDNDHYVPFTQKISELFTDSWCILEKPLSGIKVYVREKSGNVVAEFISDNEYSQLIYKQSFYKYFQEELPSEFAMSRDVLSYLDNSFHSKMSTLTDLDNGINKYILRLPFIDKEFTLSKTTQEIFDIFNNYFIVNEISDKINYNTNLVQTFFDTVHLPSQYIDAVIKRSELVIDRPVLPIDIDIILDRDKFQVSEFENFSDFELMLRIFLIKYFKKQEGFLISFYPSKLEEAVKNEFACIKNFSLKSPGMFEINNTSVIYHYIEENLEFQDLLNFIPVYFSFDYSRMKITTSF